MTLTRDSVFQECSQDVEPRNWTARHWGLVSSRKNVRWYFYPTVCSLLMRIIQQRGENKRSKDLTQAQGRGSRCSGKGQARDRRRDRSSTGEMADNTDADVGKLLDSVKETSFDGYYFLCDVENKASI